MVRILWMVGSFGVAMREGEVGGMEKNDEVFEGEIVDGAEVSAMEGVGYAML